MPGLAAALKKFFTYNGPSDIEGFELLEDKEEENGKNKEKVVFNAKCQNCTKKTICTKSPFIADELNKTKEEEAPNEQKKSADKVSPVLEVNLERMKKEFKVSDKVSDNEDIRFREFKIGGKIKAFLIFIDGMADRVIINDFVLRQLMLQESFRGFKEACTADYIIENVLSISDITKFNHYESIIEQILKGYTAIFIDGCDECLLVESKGYAKRKVEKPVAENVVNGPQEAFTENILTNTSLIRKIIKNKKLITEHLPLGDVNNISCAVMFIQGIANPKLVNEVKRRIKNLKIDYIGGTGMLEQLIEDQPFMIFPQTLSTERPDRTASYLIEGYVAIIVDGSPFASIVPVVFYSLLQTSEDSFLRWHWATALRIIRMIGMFFSLYLPGLYVAATLYHQEMIPTEILISIAKARENIPFPTILEVMIMELSFELIREGGIRVPGIIGQTLGIIGALILGQAAVAANVVSPVLIIIVSLTGLGSFTIPNNSLSTGIRTLRFVNIFFGAIAGFFGISISTFIIFGLACYMKSFGVPFFSPVAPQSKKGKDLLIRHPIWEQKERPDFLNPLKKEKSGNEPREWIKK